MKYIEIFFWGVIAAFSVLLAEFLVPELLRIFYFSPTQAMKMTVVFTLPLIALFALFEECFKFFVIAKKATFFSKPRQVFLASLAAGAAFSLSELLIIIGNSESFWQANPSELAKIAALHIATAGIMGLLVLSLKKSGARLALIILLASLIHFSFNLLALSGTETSKVGQNMLLLTIFFANLWGFFKTSPDSCRLA